MYGSLVCWEILRNSTSALVLPLIARSCVVIGPSCFRQKSQGKAEAPVLMPVDNVFPRIRLDTRNHEGFGYVWNTSHHYSWVAAC
jgi:hypothetical protein